MGDNLNKGCKLSEIEKQIEVHNLIIKIHYIQYYLQLLKKSKQIEWKVEIELPRALPSNLSFSIKEKVVSLLELRLFIFRF